MRLPRGEETLPFAGGTPLSGKTINLLVDGARIDSTTTTAGGSWAFNVMLPSGVRYIVAQFPGDNGDGRWTFGVPVGGAGTYYVYAKFNGEADSDGAGIHGGIRWLA
jgi:hypothetical protein